MKGKIYKLIEYVKYCWYSIFTYFKYKNKTVSKINLCGSGLSDYCNVDMYSTADLVIDLSKHLLPFKSDSAQVVVCISAINYFSRKRGEEIIKDTHRILKSGGVARFGVQDLLEISRKYVSGDKNFFFQQYNGRDRFKGETVCDKINSWFYGYGYKGHEKYMYDYETLSLLFKRAGFSLVEQKQYQQSRVPEIEKIDNRPDQMFFLEAIK